MAGTGKPTISRTIAHAFTRKHHLSASFFFKRGDRDRGKVAKLFTTLATQLRLSQPTLAKHIKMALDSDPAVVRRIIEDQFEKLVLESLSKSMIPRNHQAWSS
jgi:hypothetical protein